jgi:dTDP-4-dehydrorhamnose 3,5-epimerase
VIKAQETKIKGSYILYPEVFKDRRGSFIESFNKAALEHIVGHPVNFVQDNQSISHKHVLRGLHFQTGEHAQAKLVRVLRGRVLDVMVDLRKDSPSFGKHVTFELSEQDNAMLFIPKGLAHGFLSLENQTVFSYKCDAYYNPESEGGIIYNDPDLDIDWGLPDSEIILSEKDLNLPHLKDLSL